MARKKYTVEAMRACQRKKGLHFFDADTMRFFKSRIEWMGHGPFANDPVIQGPGGVFFVTSEKNNGHPRKYTVRRFNPKTCRITTQGDFQAYNTKMNADGAAHRAAKLWED